MKDKIEIVPNTKAKRNKKNHVSFLEYLPKNHTVKDGDKVYTSGKEGIFGPGIPIGEVKIEKDVVVISGNRDCN